MQDFSKLLDRLVYTPSRNGKLALIAAYMKSATSEDVGWALATLTGDLHFKTVTARVIRTLMLSQVDDVLFKLSYDYVGDLAETCALLWPTHTDDTPPSLSAVVLALANAPRTHALQILSQLLDRCNAVERWALLKLATGGLRVGVNARLAKQAFATAFNLDINAIEEIWHGLRAPYPELLNWAHGTGPAVVPGTRPHFRPFMLANPLEDVGDVHVSNFIAEWKWDGIRVQVVCSGGETCVFSRTADNISASFPEIADAFSLSATVDGELLVRATDGTIAPFNDLQQRLGRKNPSAKTLQEYPAFVRCYDILFDGSEDLRGLPLTARRQLLKSFLEKLGSPLFDFSEQVDAVDMEHLSRLRDDARQNAQEGLMLKRRDSLYEAGRKTGLWYKWKRNPLLADCVLMYAQRGHGKRSSFYSDFTFGVWDDTDTLLPVGKSYFGFTDAELKWLDQWVRLHTVARFGPVREVAKELVLEIAFDSIHESKRHKSGLAMRFPRISRIRTDKPAAEGDRLSNLQKLVANITSGRARQGNRVN